MNMTARETENIRLHVGIRTGYKQIERRGRRGLVGNKRYGEQMRPLPHLRRAIDSAGAVFQYLSSPLLHNLNRMTIMLNLWEEHLHPVPNKELKEMVKTMEKYIAKHGGKP